MKWLFLETSALIEGCRHGAHLSGTAEVLDTPRSAPETPMNPLFKVSEKDVSLFSHCTV